MEGSPMAHLLRVQSKRRRSRITEFLIHTANFCVVSTFRPDLLLPVYIPKDYHTGAPRGFAYVQYFDEEDTRRVYESGKEFTLDGRRLQMEYAQGRRKSPNQMRTHGRRPSRSAERDYHPRSRSRDRRRRDYSRSRSPMHRYSRPRSRSRSPRRRSPSPRRRSSRRSLSPRRRSYSPRGRSYSPRRRSPSPRDRTLRREGSPHDRRSSLKNGGGDAPYSPRDGRPHSPSPERRGMPGTGADLPQRFFSNMDNVA
ncbi:hypothetical protein EDD21DRAFT_390032 [Dissophora ornata]|nr:hypothetical protein EDD21DRAFT_390032 [Dissophora ornata]